jgi:hypothetical protein
LGPELTRPSVRVEGYSQCPFTTRFPGGATERLPRQSASMVTSMSWVSVAGKTRCEAFSSAIFSLIIGVAGAVVGGRGFANTLQHTLNTVGAVPRVRSAGLFPRLLAHLRTAVASRPHRRGDRGCQHRGGDRDLPRLWRPTGTEGQPDSRDDFGLRVLRRALPGGCGRASADALHALRRCGQRTGWQILLTAAGIVVPPSVAPRPGRRRFLWRDSRVAGMAGAAGDRDRLRD